jgi:hypothetical protein
MGRMRVALDMGRKSEIIERKMKSEQFTVRLQHENIRKPNERV